MEQVKLLSMTTILTVLIWAGADSLVNETASIPITIDLIPADGLSDMLIEADQRITSFELEVSGPRSTIKSVLAQAPLKIRLTIADRPTGKTGIRLDRDMLKQAIEQQWHEFHDLSIGSISPDVIDVTVDHMITRSIAITAHQSTLSYDVEPQLQRTTATVYMRESVFLSRDSDTPLQIDLSQDIDRLFKEQPVGKRITIPVALDTRPFGPNADIKPSTIEVTAAVQTQLSTEQISTVPILLAVSVVNLEKPFRAVTRDGSPLSLMTQTITVVGQKEEVARLKRGETRAYGIIQLKQEDFDAPGALKLVTPDYHLPQGLRLADQPSPIEFKLIDLSISTVDR